MRQSGREKGGEKKKRKGIKKMVNVNCNENETEKKKRHDTCFITHSKNAYVCACIKEQIITIIIKIVKWVKQ